MRDLEKLDTSVYATSVVYYKKEDIEQLVNVFSQVDIIDFRLKALMAILEKKLKGGAFNSLPENPEERKEKIKHIIYDGVNAIPDAMKRAKILSWLDGAMKRECDFELFDELLYRYCWADFMDRVRLEDKKQSDFHDKLSIKPVVPAIKRNPIKTIEDIVAESSTLEDVTNDTGVVYPTGLDALDEIVKMRRSNFVVVAARPTIGKSLFMINHAIQCARDNHEVLYVSLEESQRELSKRMLINIGDDPKRASILKRVHIFTPDTGSPTVVLNDIADFVKQNGITVVFIDYIQLMKYSGQSDWDSQRALTREFKLFAIRNDILLVTASQVRRDAEMVGSSLSTLYGSSTLEADANVVLFLETARKNVVRQNNCTSIRIIVAKNRSGAQGQIDDVIIDYSLGRITIP